MFCSRSGNGHRLIAILFYRVHDISGKQRYPQSSFCVRARSPRQVPSSFFWESHQVAVSLNQKPPTLGIQRIQVKAPTLFLLGPSFMPAITKHTVLMQPGKVTQSIPYWYQASIIHSSHRKLTWIRKSKWWYVIRKKRHSSSPVANLLRVTPLTTQTLFS